MAHHDLQNNIDQILLQDVDNSNEWLVREVSVNLQDAEDELVFEDDSVTRRDVIRISDVGELQTYTRQMMKAKMNAKASNSSPIIIEEEEIYFD